MSRDSTSARGREAEARAVEYLRGQGYRIVERNYRCRWGELDIVARMRDTLVFVEVRMRRDSRHGSALETVGVRKQRRIASTARAYIALRRPRFQTCRFDVIGITDGELQHVADAFRPGLDLGF